MKSKEIVSKLVKKQSELMSLVKEINNSNNMNRGDGGKIFKDLFRRRMEIEIIDFVD